MSAKESTQKQSKEIAPTSTKSTLYNVRPEVAPRLVKSGLQKIVWASKHMPIIKQIVAEYKSAQPLKDNIVVVSIHMEAKTAFLVQCLADLGARVYATGCNPLTVQDDVAAALNTYKNVTVFAKHTHDEAVYWHYLKKALSYKPNIIIDDGGDLVKLLHGDCSDYAKRVIGGCEETTTGIVRLKALAAKNELKFPMINVNDADCKHNYDNHFGTGQSVIDGLLRTTNLIVAGKTAVVAGYGDCGSGIAMRLKGLGAKVIITEINPIKALKANMDGFTVMTMDKAAPLGDFFITATGCRDVIVKKHFDVMKDGAILANAGHFNVEINVDELNENCFIHYSARKNIEAYDLKNGRTIYLLAEGRLVNLAAADGHAAEIMDMSFSIQLLSAIDMAQHSPYKMYPGFPTPPGLYSVDTWIDTKVAKLALKAQNITIDELTREQREYLKNGF